MKKLKHFALIAVFTVMLAVLTACGVTAEKWAYIHEPGEEILSLASNGKAVYKGTGYTYTKDDSYIHLKGKDNSTADLRYVMDGDRMILYEAAVYYREGGETEDGIYGLWKQENGRNLFQFTKDGKFSEENIFYGHYGLDKDNGTIKLMYDEPIEDALLYYTLEGDTLTIDYPWPLVSVAQEEGK